MISYTLIFSFKHTKSTPFTAQNRAVNAALVKRRSADYLLMFWAATALFHDKVQPNCREYAFTACRE